MDIILDRKVLNNILSMVDDKIDSNDISFSKITKFLNKDNTSQTGVDNNRIQYNRLQNNLSQTPLKIIDKESRMNDMIFNEIIYDGNTNETNILYGTIRCWFCDSLITGNQKRWMIPRYCTRDNDKLTITFNGDGAFCYWACAHNFINTSNIYDNKDQIRNNLNMLYKYYADFPYNIAPMASLKQYYKYDFVENGGLLNKLDYLIEASMFENATEDDEEKANDD
jgi:hypothetical protein